MRLILLFLRPLYYLLYHQFAWAYDFVAALVSLRHWQDWVRIALPYLDGRVLEIGFGPGHLQCFLNENNMLAYGLDASRQMAFQSKRLLRKQGLVSRLSIGYAQFLPFPDGVFDSVASTFPSEYIFDPQTLAEIHRVLATGGKLVILPMAWNTGSSPVERLAAWLFRITGEAPGMPGQMSKAIKARFAQAGFDALSKIVAVKNSQVLVIIATKSMGDSREDSLHGFLNL